MERGTKGSKRETARGAKGSWKGAKRIAPCIHVNVMCMLKKIERLNDAIIVYIQQ